MKFPQNQYNNQHHYKKFTYLWTKHLHLHSSSSSSSPLFHSTYPIIFHNLLIGTIFQFLSILGYIFFPQFLKNFLKLLQPPSPIPGLGLGITQITDNQFFEFYHILPENLRPPKISINTTSHVYQIINEIYGRIRENDYMIWIWLFLYIGVRLVCDVCQCMSFYYGGKVGICMNYLVTRKLYEKIFKVKNGDDFDEGKILNLFTVDCRNLLLFYKNVHYYYWRFFLIGLSVIMLIYMLNIAFLIVLGCFIIIGIVFIILSVCLFKINKKYMIGSDKIYKIIKQTFENINLIKMFNWESVFLNNIYKAIKDENKVLNKWISNHVLLLSMAINLHIILMITTFLCYYFLNNELDVSVVIVSSVYFSYLFRLFYYLPSIVNSTNDFIISWNRIQDFLLAEEWEESEIIKKGNNLVDFPILDINNCSFEWEIGVQKKVAKRKTHNYSLKSMSNPDVELQNIFGSVGFNSSRRGLSNIDNNNVNITLANVNLHVKRGEIITIVGSATSGKSNVLLALLGEFNQINPNGKFQVYGKKCFGEQSPFFLNDNVKNNITFHLPYNEKTLNECISVCDLLNDLKILENGLDSHLGDSGNKLPEGMKHKVQLARCCYRKDVTDIYLFDQPFESLNRDSAIRLFENCFKKYLRGKTIIFTTNRVEFCNESDKILFVKKYDNIIRIVEKGTSEELSSFKSGEFSKFFQYVKKGNDDRTNKKKNIDRKSEKKKIQLNIQKRKYKKKKDDDSVFKTRLKILINFPYPFASLPIFALSILLLLLSIIGTKWWLGNIISKRHFHSKFDTMYTTYYFLNTTNNVSLYYNPFNGSCPVSNEYCFSKIVDIKWCKYENVKCNVTDGLSVYQSFCIYGGIVGLLCITMFAFYFLVFFLHKSSLRKLFKIGLKKIFSSSMLIFDDKSSHEIVTTIHSYIGKADRTLPQRTFRIFRYILYLIADYVIICYSNALMIPIASVFYLIYILSLYMYHSVHVKLKKRLKGSKLFFHIKDTLKGVRSIRACGAEDVFIKKNHSDIHLHSKNIYYGGIFDILSIWFGMGVFNAVFQSSLYSLMIIIAYYLGNFDNDVYAFLGLAVSISSKLSLPMKYLLVNLSPNIGTIKEMRKFFNFTNNYGSLEHRYSFNNQNEFILKGKIEFQNYGMRYNKLYHPVLKNVSFVLPAGKRLMIFGKNGKSTLIQSLFRLYDRTLTTGKILIDDIDIVGIPVCNLREKISIIGQDPTLFEGSVRFNIDPLFKCDENEFGKYLAKCKIGEIFDRKLSLELDNDKYSHGEKLLFSLARILLRKNKIVLLDEIYSYLDSNTEKLVKSIIQRELSQCTVILATKKLENCIDYDYLMGIQDGKIVEFGTLESLYTNKNSFFHGLVNQCCYSQFLNELINSYLKK